MSIIFSTDSFNGLKHNHSQFRREAYFKNKDLYAHNHAVETYKLKEATPEKIAENRKRREGYGDKEKKKNLLYFSLSIGITFSIFYFLFFDEAFLDFIYRFLSGW